MAHADLYEAAGNGDIWEVRRRLRSGVNPNGCLLRSDTALHVAARRGHSRVVVELLHAGASHDVTGPNGNLPLHEAAAQGHLEVIAILLKYGADNLACNDHNNTPLHDAVSSGQLEVVEALFSIPGAQALIHTCGEGGFTPYTLARHYGFCDILNYLDEPDQKIGPGEFYLYVDACTLTVGKTGRLVKNYVNTFVLLYFIIYIMVFLTVRLSTLFI